MFSFEGMTRVGAKYKRSKNQIVLSQSHKDRRVAMCFKWIIEDHDWNLTIFSDENALLWTAQTIRVRMSCRVNPQLEKEDNAKAAVLWYD